MQGISVIDLRSVTPEVAGSSPVAPVRKCLELAISVIQAHRNLVTEMVTVFGSRRRSRFVGFAAAFGAATSGA
jgi:hypothetical protein